MTLPRGAAIMTGETRTNGRPDRMDGVGRQAG